MHVARGVARVHNALEDLSRILGHALVDDLLGIVLVLVDRVAVAVLDLGDGDGVAVHAVGGKDAVGLAHLERRDARGAKDQRGDGLEVRVDAHEVGRLDELVNANGHDHLRVAGVGRELGSARKAYVAVLCVLVVVRRPGRRDLHGGVAVENHRRVHAIDHGGHEHERLEAGACLSLAYREVNGALALALVVSVVGAAHHCHDVPVGVVNGDKRRRELVVARAGDQAVHRLVGGVLLVGLEGGVDAQAALEDGVVVEVVLEERLHVVGEVGV